MHADAKFFSVHRSSENYVMCMCDLFVDLHMKITTMSHLCKDSPDTDEDTWVAVL